MEKLIEEAKERYPKGSKFILFGSLHKFEKFEKLSTGNFLVSSLDDSKIVMDDHEGTYVYQNGKWAEKLT